MTLILNLDLDMVKMYLYAKNEITNYSGSKVIQTDRPNWDYYLSTYADGNKHILDILLFSTIFLEECSNIHILN